MAGHVDKPGTDEKSGVPEEASPRQQAGSAPHRITRILRRMLVMVLVCFVGFYAVFYFAQTPMVFQSERELLGDPSVHDWAFENVLLSVRGETTHGWFIPLKDARGVILFSHGNDGNISTRLDAVWFFRSLGFSVLMYDYGGFGQSTGTPSEKRVNADAFAMWSCLTETRGIPPEQIVLWGRSFGGGATCELARQVQPAAVILESTFTSMADAAFQDYPWFPARLFLRHRFDNVDKVELFKAPTLIIHSRDDTLYPFHHGQALFDRTPEPKQFLEIRGDHGEGAHISKDVYEPGIRNFLRNVRSDPTT